MSAAEIAAAEAAVVEAFAPPVATTPSAA